MHRYNAYCDRHNHNKTLQAASALRRRCDGQEDMTLAKIIEVCKESGLPISPLAVTRLELNCQLFTRIGECIKEYRDVQQLHLDGNRISHIENLAPLVHLRCLHLQGNAIRDIEGLEGLVQLQLLNLSGNAISRLSGLGGLPRLEALLVSDNLLRDGPSIEHLTCCRALCELDLGHNHLADAEGVLQVLSAMVSLQTLTLAHNPMSTTASTASGPAAGRDSAPQSVGSAAAADVTAQSSPAPPLTFYRRTVVARCRQLAALDHRAVLPQERRYAESWWEEVQQQQRLVQSRMEAARGSPGGRGAVGASRAPTADGTGPAGPAAGGAAASGEAAAQPDGARLPVDVLYPVLTRLDARALVMAALSCRHWCGVAALPLAQQRLTRAQGALCDAAAAVPWLAAAITQVRRDELDELLASGPPARPLVQLFFALDVLWRQYRGKLRAVAAQRREGLLRPSPRAEGGQPTALHEPKLPTAASPLRPPPPPSAPPGAPEPTVSAAARGTAATGLEPTTRTPGSSATAASMAVTAGAGCGVAAGGAPVPGSAKPDGVLQSAARGAVHDGPAPEWNSNPESGLRLDPELNPSDMAGVPTLLLACGWIEDADGPSLDFDGGAAREPDADQGAGGDVGHGESADLIRDLESVDLDLDLDLDLEPEPLDLDSQTWRMASWEAALRLLRDREFPLPGLPAALPLGPRGLAALRCRTGSADDLDFYVPQLRPEDVARHNGSAGRLAEWLLGVEAHCRAAHEVDTARVWDWPTRVVRQPAGGDGRNGGMSSNDVHRRADSSSSNSIIIYGGANSLPRVEAGRGDDCSRGFSPERHSMPQQQQQSGHRAAMRWMSASAAAEAMQARVADILTARQAEAEAKAAAEAEARAQVAAAAAAAAAPAAAPAAAAAATRVGLHYGTGVTVSGAGGGGSGGGGDDSGPGDGDAWAGNGAGGPRACAGVR